MKTRRNWVRLELPATRPLREKRHGAAALQDAGARSRARAHPQGFGVRQPHAGETVETVNHVSVLETTSLKRGVNETSAPQFEWNRELSIFNLCDLLTLKRKLSLLTRFWRRTVELAEITNLNLQQKN